MIIRPYHVSDRERLVALWRNCGLVVAHNNPHRDIDRKLAVDPLRLLVGELDDEIIVSCMVGYDGHRGWLNYLACAPAHRKNGFARQMVAHAEQLLRDAGCPKINVQIRSNNRQVIDFYRELGFNADDVLNVGKRLEHDTPG